MSMRFEESVGFVRARVARERGGGGTLAGVEMDICDERVSYIYSEYVLV